MAIKDVQLGPRAMERTVAKVPQITTKNRFIEGNLIENQSQFSFISRPALKKWIEVGTGHIRKVFSEPGVFGDDLFVVSETFLYRVSNDGASRLLGQLSTQPLGSVSMAATAPIGDGPSAVVANLFIAEGGVLWLYNENAPARGLLQFTGAISDTETVEINGVYYEFTSGSVDAGTPAGTLADPWLVQNTGLLSTTVQNLADAINATGEGGVKYSTALTAHPDVKSTANGPADLFVTANAPGTTGNTYTTTETGANMAWGGATMADGGTEGLRQVIMPEDYGAISVAHINSYIIVVPVQLEETGTNGRFYWINPGEITVDANDFATAERSPDKLHQVKVFSNMFWLLGEKTTEPWITTGDALAPMERFQGILFDRGTWEGTTVQVKDSLIMVDEDGGVFQIRGDQNRISTPEVEEKIRRAIQIEDAFFV